MNDNPLSRIEATRRALKASCRDAGAWISGDGRIGEEDAARLLGISSGTLANKRADGTAPPFYQLGGGGHRITFALFDIASWIESARCE